MSLFQYAWILTDDYGHDNDDHADYHDSHNNEDFITEMFLGHVASLHTLGGDGFATQFEQVEKLNESFFLTEMRKRTITSSQASKMCALAQY